MTADPAPERRRSPGRPALELHEWQHLHPLSPLLRGGVVGVAILGYALSQFVDDLFRGFGSEPDDGPVRGATDDGIQEGVGFLVDHLLAAAAGLVVVLSIVGLVGWLSWRYAKFRVADGQIEFRKGWLFREHRQVPLDRVQAIETSRPLLAQVVGLSQVIVQSAGGGDSNLTLAFLGSARAEEVRRALLALAARHDEDGPVAADRHADSSEGAEPAALAEGDVGLRLDEGREVLRVPNSRLFVATILHGGTIVLGVLGLIGASVALAAYGSTLEALTGAAIALPAIGPLAFGIIVNRVGELLRHGNFRLAETGRSLRIQHGLTDKRTTTVPLHRVQAVGMTQPPWWRPLGWWRVQVNVAGVGHDPTGQGGDGDTVVLPVGTLDQALQVLTLLDPDLSADSLRRAALGEGEEGGWTLVSPRARVFDWLSWRRAGYAVSSRFLIVRAGRLWRQVSAMPHARVQSMTLAQGPLERRRDLASLTVVSTPGPVDVAVHHLDVSVATRLLHEEAARARVAGQISRRPCESGEIPSQLVVPGELDER